MTGRNSQQIADNADSGTKPIIDTIPKIYTGIDNGTKISNHWHTYWNLFA